MALPRLKASYDSKKEWSADPKGYFLIKLFPEKREIGVRWMDYDREPQLEVYGTDAESIVQTLVREGLVSTLQHAAYLGFELHKAEVALRLGLSYVQDEPLELQGLVGFSGRQKKRFSTSASSRR